MGRCKSPSADGPKSLTVSNAGEVQIHDGDDRDGIVICKIHEVKHGSEMPPGRQAVVVAALVSKIVNSWPGTFVQFFTYTYDDPSLNKSTSSITN